MENFADFKHYYCGCVATITAKENCYVRISFSNEQNQDHKLKSPDPSENPDLVENALSAIKKRFPEYEPKCLLCQGKNWVLYYFKRIL